jgi:hypothetical protein
MRYDTFLMRQYDPPTITIKMEEDIANVIQRGIKKRLREKTRHQIHGAKRRVFFILSVLSNKKCDFSFSFLFLYLPQRAQNLQDVIGCD